jgi:hypothetical protein
MSAYFCPDSVFHLIATYAATVKASNQLETVWRMLIQENLKSLNHRYPANQADNVKTAANALRKITDRPMLPLPDPAVIKSALKEYDYQSCKHPTYEASAAGQLVTHLFTTINKPAAVSQDGGWYDIDTITATPQPTPPAPAPGADPIEAARASLLAAFNAPAAPEPIAPEPKPDELKDIGIKARTRALIVLLTLERLSERCPDAERFSTLISRIGATITATERAEASAEAAKNVASLAAVWTAA